MHYDVPLALAAAPINEQRAWWGMEVCKEFDIEASKYFSLQPGHNVPYMYVAKVCHVKQLCQARTRLARYKNISKNAYECCPCWFGTMNHYFEMLDFGALRARKCRRRPIVLSKEIDLKYLSRTLRMEKYESITPKRKVVFRQDNLGLQNINFS